MPSPEPASSSFTAIGGDVLRCDVARELGGEVGAAPAPEGSRGRAVAPGVTSPLFHAAWK
jgi:hypothetical protein